MTRIYEEVGVQSEKSTGHCFQCRRRFIYCFAPSRECPQQFGGCGKLFCVACMDFSCVTEKDGFSLGRNAPIVSFCENCFKINSSIDFDVAFDIFGPDVGQSPCVLFVHSAGGSRKTFEYHAKKLSELTNYRCVLVDLPGHGSRINEILTLESAFEVIKYALLTLTADYKGVKPIAVGGSLGGYLVMEFNALYPNLISGAIITMCGQYYGPHRSLSAEYEVSVMGFLTYWLRSKPMMELIMSHTNKIKAQLDEELLLNSSLRTGMFFKQGPAQMTIVRKSNPFLSLPKFSQKILFINGSKDRNNSQEIWLKLSKRGELKVYKDGDHFFSHDKRFVAAFIDDIKHFCWTVFEE
jgi:pimeloyl-ACP methyl ester carboxylesterase